MSKDRKQNFEQRGLGGAKLTSPKPTPPSNKAMTGSQGGGKNIGAKPLKK